MKKDCPKVVSASTPSERLLNPFFYRTFKLTLIQKITVIESGF